MRYFLGIDVGTSSVKAVFMGEDGTQAAAAQKEYEILRPQQNFAEQKMEQVWEAAAAALRSLTGRYPQISRHLSGIGFSGQMHGLVMLDRAGREVRNTIIWADQRSADAVRCVYEKIPQKEYGAVTCNALSTGFLASSLVWVRDHEPENYERIHKVMLPKDYIRYRICGQMGTDLSDASGTGVFDAAGKQWAWDIIRRIGLEESFFVPCHASAETAGTVTQACARETGLAEGVLTAYGGGDTPVQALGNGAADAGMLIANIGTAGQLMTVCAQPVFDRRFRTNTFCHADAEHWLLMGANLNGGMVLQWLKNNILSIGSFEELNALAQASPPGSRGLFFLPYLNGERTPWNDPDARGVYFGLQPGHSREDLVRAAMEGILYAQRQTLEIFREMGMSFARVIISGGGAASGVLRKILADQSGCEVVRSLVKEQACAGAAVTAAAAAGVYPDFKEACRHMVHFSSEIIQPDAENQKRYEEKFRLFQEIYPANRELFALCRKQDGI